MTSNFIVDVVDKVGSQSPIVPAGAMLDAEAKGSRIGVLAFRDLANEVLIDFADPRADNWVQIANTLREMQRPSAVAVDPATNLVTDVLVPDVGRIVALTESFDGTVGVHLDSSPTPLELPADMPDARTTVLRLKEAFAKGVDVVITTDPLDDLIRDVRELNRPVTRGHRLSYYATEDDFIETVAVLSEAEAQTLFNNLGQSCSFPVSNTCLPFRYTKDYCFAVANFIVNFLADSGHSAGKAWLYGALAFDTPNRRKCRQKWNYHVAAFVRLTNSFDRRDLLVFDPVVFPKGPRPLGTWRKTLGQPRLTPVITDGTVYRQSVPGHGVGEFKDETQKNLALARAQLAALPKNEFPPYRWC